MSRFSVRSRRQSKTAIRADSADGVAAVPPRREDAVGATDCPAGGIPG